jgi:uncharacterized membrane protein
MIHTNKNGKLRLLYRTPDWDEFINLAITEIRHYGKDSILYSLEVSGSL